MHGSVCGGGGGGGGEGGGYGEHAGMQGVKGPGGYDEWPGRGGGFPKKSTPWHNTVTDPKQTDTQTDHALVC